MTETLAYVLGWKASTEGQSLDMDNPLPVGTSAWQAWRDGWLDQEDDAELCVGATVAAVCSQTQHDNERA